ncbi:hypothetical protein OQI89_02140 [Lentilactobacillus diolivorans]|uniref:hypothetical protein n=1 Tax=Lentilactobacillus diolivorans TaxID=179838 RepID=UPI00246934B2|nr:hypothetical protein [Lentilactobacillus diolivorans]MDH5104645.1 hypothetical protein [Lentilactobacillus diolivorans]
MSKKCPIDGRRLTIFNKVQIKDGAICSHCLNKVGLIRAVYNFKKFCQSLTIEEVKNMIANGETIDPDKYYKEEEEKKNAEIAFQKEKQRIEEQKQQETLDWMRNGDLTEVARGTDKIILHKNEYLFYEITGNVPWYEERTHTERRGYSGMGVSFRVAKGVYLHSGRSYPMNRKYTQNEIVHSGEILLTNKRLLLVSSNDSAQINLSSIVNATPYADGIVIQKNRGKDVTLGDFDGEELAILLTRLASNDLYTHSGYVDPSLTSKIPIDDFAQAISKDLLIRQDKQSQFLDVVTEGDLSELKNIYIYKYEDYNDTIDNLISKAYEMYKFIESKTDTTGYTIRLYADKEFKQLIFQFKNGQMEYLLFTDPKFIDYLNTN